MTIKNASRIASFLSYMNTEEKAGLTHHKVRSKWQDGGCPAAPPAASSAGSGPVSGSGLCCESLVLKAFLAPSSSPCIYVNEVDMGEL